MVQTQGVNLPYHQRGLRRMLTPVERVIAVVGGKWKARMLFRLALGSASVGDLQRHLGRVRPQVLLAQLQALEAHGMIVRLAPEPVQSWGDYALTEEGRKLFTALGPVAEWGTQNLGGWTPPSISKQPSVARTPEAVASS